MIGNDLTVTLAAENGELELNAFEPVVAIAILESQELFVTGMTAFRTTLRRRHHRERGGARGAHRAHASASSPR